MKKNKFLLILIVTFILVLAIEMPAKVIHVTTTRDNIAGSLRESISTANRNSEPDVIYLPAGTYLLTGRAGDDANAGGDLDLNSMHKINIIGAGRNLTFVDGNGLDRVFHILKGKVTMSGVTIRGGKAKYIGGGIWNEGNLVLSHCTISGNTTNDGSPCITEEWGEMGGSSGWGGGISNFGSLMLTHCIITNNRTGKGGSGGLGQTGGSSGSGAGIFNYEDGNIIMTNCTISHNIIGAGGDAYGGGNGGSGGGIYNFIFAEIKCYQCTFNDNVAGKGGFASSYGNSFPPGNGGDGGGIFNYHSIELVNCTISQNSTGAGGSSNGGLHGYSGNGGGICNTSDENGMGYHNMDLTNCTVTHNRTAYTPYHSGWGGGIYNWFDVNLLSCIVANNWVPYVSNHGSDCWGKLYSIGYNLIENTTGCEIDNQEGNGDILGQDPLLGPLANNGGFTQTHALLPGSPAIDAGYCPRLQIDQRGFRRPIEIMNIPNAADGSDIGAYEVLQNKFESN